MLLFLVFWMQSEFALSDGIFEVLDLDQRPKETKILTWKDTGNGFVVDTYAQHFLVLPLQGSPKDLGEFPQTVLIAAWDIGILAHRPGELFVIDPFSGEERVLLPNLAEPPSLVVESTEGIWLGVDKRGLEYHVLFLERAQLQLRDFGLSKIENFFSFRNELWVWDQDGIGFFNPNSGFEFIPPPDPLKQVVLHGGNVYVSTINNAIYIWRDRNWGKLYEASRLYLLQSNQQSPLFFRVNYSTFVTDGTFVGTHFWNSETPLGIDWPAAFALYEKFANNRHEIHSQAKGGSGSHLILSVPYKSRLSILAGSDLGIWFEIAEFNSVETKIHNQIWFTDGTSGGTRKLAESRSERQVLSFSSAGFIDQKWYFFKGQRRDYFDLWTSDGTENGTYQVPAQFPHTGSLEQAPDAMATKTAIGFLTQMDDWGTEPAFTDGRSQKRWADFSIGDKNEWFEWAELGDKLAVVASSAQTGTELVILEQDGRLATHDLVPGPDSSQPRRLFNSGNQLFFNLQNPDRVDPDGNGSTFWKYTDGELMPLEDSNYLFPSVFLDFEGLLYFVGKRGSSAGALFQTDGSPKGDMFVKGYGVSTCDGPFCSSMGGNMTLLGLSGKTPWLAIEPGHYSPFLLYRFVPGILEPQRVPDAPRLPQEYGKKLELVGEDGFAYLHARDHNLYLMEPDSNVWRFLASPPENLKEPQFLARVSGGYVLADTNVLSEKNPIFFLADGTRNWQKKFEFEGDGRTLQAVTQGELPYFFLKKHLPHEGDQLWFVDENFQLQPVSHDNSLKDQKVLGWFGHWLYFSAQTEGYGNEIWRFHGPTGTLQLAWDILPGPESSNPKHMIQVGATFYIVADLPGQGLTLLKVLEPVGFAGSDQIVCDIAVLAGTPSSGKWQFVSGIDGYLEDPFDPQTQCYGQPGQSYKLAWCFSLNGLADYRTVQVEFEPPLDSSAGPDLQVCLGKVDLHAQPFAWGSGKWVFRQGSGSISNPYSPNTTVYLTTVSPEPIELAWVNIKSECDQDFSSVGIENFSSRQNYYSNWSICGESVRLDGVLHENESGFWRIVSGEGGELADPEDPTSLFSGLPNVGYKLVWTVAGGLCGDRESSVYLRFTFPGKIKGPHRAHPNQWVTLTAPAGARSYLWSTGSQESSIRFQMTQTRNVWVDVESTDGCTVHLEHLIQFAPNQRR